MKLEIKLSYWPCVRAEVTKGFRVWILIVQLPRTVINYVPSCFKHRN